MAGLELTLGTALEVGALFSRSADKMALATAIANSFKGFGNVTATVEAGVSTPAEDDGAKEGAVINGKPAAKVLPVDHPCNRNSCDMICRTRSQ